MAAANSIANSILVGVDLITRAVGNAAVTSGATVWHHDSSQSGTWHATRLHDIAVADPCWDELVDALDINDNHWIVGNGVQFDIADSCATPGTDTAAAAYVAIPGLPCVGDITGPSGCSRDYFVDVSDLLALLQHWGPVSAGCGADINGDGTVDTQDLLAVLAAWGECHTGNGSVPETVSDCLQKFAPGTLELEKCLEAVGGSS